MQAKRGAEAEGTVRVDVMVGWHSPPELAHVWQLGGKTRGDAKLDVEHVVDLAFAAVVSSIEGEVAGDDQNPG
jgi:hypothetical protein